MNDFNKASKDETLAVAKSLESVMVGLTTQVKALNARADKIDQALTNLDESDKKGKKRDIWLGISVVIDVILSIALGIVSYQANETSNKATKASIAAASASDKATLASDKATEATSVAAESIRTQKVTCEAGNISRKLNRDLWDYVLTVSAAQSPTPQTPEQLDRIENFRTYITTTFADRDCSNLQQVPETPAPLAPSS